MKSDAEDYLIGLFYIFSSNSPYPITSSDNLFSQSNPFLQTITSAITTRDAKKLDDLSVSAQKMVDQMKTMEVPEDLVDTHIQAIQFTLLATQMKQYIGLNATDPVADLTNVSKLQGFMDSLASFTSDFQSKISEYGITYDDSVKKKLDNLGIKDSTVLEQALNASNSGLNLQTLQNAGLTD